jgi:hypothetical protein
VPGNLPLHIEQGIFHLARGFDHFFRFRGQHVTGIAAIEDATIQVFLKFVDPAQHRSSIDLEFARGRRDRAFIRDHKYVAQVIPVNVLHICSTIAQ